MFRRNRFLVAAISLLSIVAGFAQAAILLLVVQIATTLAGSDTTVTGELGPLGSLSLPPGHMITLAFAITGGLLLIEILNSYLTASIATRIIHREQRDYLDLYSQVVWQVQDEEADGDLQLMLVQSTAMGGTSATQAIMGLVAFCNFVALVAAAVIVNPLATLTVVVGMGLLSLAVRPLRLLTRRNSQRAIRGNESLANLVSQMVSLSKEITTFDVRDIVQDRADKLVDRLAWLNLRRNFYMRLSPSLLRNGALLLMLAAIALVYVLDIHAFASLAAVVLILVRALSHSQALQSAQHALYEALPWVEALWARGEAYSESPQQRNGLPVKQIGEIAFDGVTFAYVPSHPALIDVSFSAASGESIGIVGPSGAGKSTLIQLLLRLRVPDSGSIYVSGMDLTSLDLGDWYRKVAFVPQEPRTVPGSIAENIRFFRQDLTEEQVARAVQLAHLDRDIARMPLGMDTPVGERGGKLSGGQRQRLAIARALVQQPEVLILDEPTSALDARSEALVQETLDSLHGQVTMFIVAHRLSTLTHCDRLLVFEDGRLQAYDSADTLERSNSFFRAAVRQARS